MAHLTGRGDDRVAFAAFGVSLLDMSVPNVAGLALHPALHCAARLATEATGVVDGRAIAAVFSWLRPTELAWNQWVNNYLMGQAPPQHDILAWNNDTTRVSGALQRDLLAIATDNLLATPGG
jgi:poly[(R)-3-hydroxyalkanoate] polymerase subunit PhaC